MSDYIDRDAAHAAVDKVCRDDLSDYYGDVRQRMHEALDALVRPVDAFDPGLGWREVTYQQFRLLENPDPYLRVTDEDGDARYWVRVPLVASS